MASHHQKLGRAQVNCRSIAGALPQSGILFDEPTRETPDRDIAEFQGTSFYAETWVRTRHDIYKEQQ